MADKNEKWIYAGGMAIILILLICFTGQPLRFLQNTKILACPGCNATGGGCDGGGNATWDGNCFGLLGLAVKDKCCFEVPCPTCELNIATQECVGTCPVPPSWIGWTGTCVKEYATYGFACKCVYLQTPGSTTV